MKIIFTLRRLFRDRRALRAAEQEAAWRRDPLSHPELKRMSLRDLADLPFNRPCRQGGP